MSPGGAGADATGQWLPSELDYGTCGWCRIFFESVANGPFARNQVLTGGTSGAKVRVIEVGANFLVCERLSPFPPLTAVQQAPGVPGIRMLETVTADNSPATTASVTYVVEQSQFVISGFPLPYDGQPDQLLASAHVNRMVPANAGANIWWDAGAHLGAELPVASGSAINTALLAQNGIGRIEGATSGARALVVGVVSNTLWLANVTGTFTNGENLRLPGGGTLTTVAGTITTKTAGEWVPYACRPNLNGVGRRWENPPAGSDVAYRAGSIGMEPRLVQLAYERWGGSLAAFKLDVNGPNSGNASGFGGVTYGVINCTGTFPASLTLGSTVTQGSFSATLVAYNVGAKRLWVKDTNGVSMTSGTVTIGAQTATASGNVLGFMKGAAHYQGFLTMVSAGAAKLPVGDTLDWTEGFVFLDSVEGDIGIPFFDGVTSFGPSNIDMTAAWRKFATDIRAALAAPNLTIVAFSHRLDYRAQTKPNVSGLQRISIRDASIGDSRLRQVIADEESFPAAVAATGAVAPPAEVVYLETAVYPLLGDLIWSAYSVASQSLPSTDLGEAAVVLFVGTSQMTARIPVGWWEAEDDPELAKLSSLAGTNTLDSAQRIWNCLSQQWELYSVRDNAVTFGDQILNWSGPEVSALKRLGERYGTIYAIKVSHNGSAMNPAPATGYATWGSVARVTVTSSVTVTVPQSGRGRFTAASGAPFAGGQWAAGAFLQISGNDGGNGLYAGFGGNNTFPEPNVVPLQIAAVDPAGTWLEVSGVFAADGTASSTTFTKGPLDLRRIAGAEIRKALQALVTVENKIPRHVATIGWDGENDCANPIDYGTYLQAHIEWSRSVFGHRVGREPPCPYVLIQVTRNTPFDVSEDRTNVDSIRAQQVATAAAMENVVLVDPTDLPLRLEAGTWPRLTFADYGGHHTPRAAVTAGYRADAALDGFGWIEPHPSGPVTAEQSGYPETVGGSGSGGGDSGSLLGDIVDVPVLVVEDGTGRADADSYESVEYADAYHDKYGGPAAWVTATTDQKILWMRQSVRDYVDGVHEILFDGIRTVDGQGLAWPRMLTRSAKTGRAVPSNVVPVDVKVAQVLGAFRLAEGKDLAPAQTAEARNIVAESKSGAGFSKSTTYGVGGRSVLAAFPEIDRLLEQFHGTSDAVSRA